VLPEGTIIGSYRVVDALGQGAMGAVYLVEHTLLGRKAAIKVLLPEVSANREIIERFFNEAKAVTQIADPGIVQVFDFGRDGGNAYIVMELLEGETLAARLARTRRLPVTDVVRLVWLLALSLQSAHGKGIVHRDLKPENIFIVTDPAVIGGARPKILDFGVAKLSRDEHRSVTRSGAVIGTPLYMSPEQCRGADDVDHRADIYALACVMMTMLTGKPPFDYNATGALIIAHVSESPPRASSRVSGIPAEIDRLLERALAKDPSDRFQTMAELARSLAEIELEPRMQPAASQPITTAVREPKESPTTATTLSGAAAGARFSTSAGTRRRGVLFASLGVLGIGAAIGVALAVRGPDDASRSQPDLPQTPRPPSPRCRSMPASVQPRRRPIARFESTGGQRGRRAPPWTEATRCSALANHGVVGRPSRKRYDPRDARRTSRPDHRTAGRGPRSELHRVS